MKRTSGFLGRASPVRGRSQPYAWALGSTLRTVPEWPCAWPYAWAVGLILQTVPEWPCAWPYAWAVGLILQTVPEWPCAWPRRIRPPNPAWPVYPSLGSSPARSSLIFAFLMDTYSFLIFAFLMKGRPSLGRAAPVQGRSQPYAWVLGPIWRTVSEWPCAWPPRLVPPNPASGRLSLSRKQPHKELPYLCLLNEYI